MQLHELKISELHKSLINKEVSYEALLKHFLSRRDQLDKKLHAFLDKEVVEPGSIDINSSVLAGIPFAVKDNITLEGQPAGAASKILEGYKAPYTATALKNLFNQDAILVGRTNCDEFAMGSSTENSAYGPSFNPWDLERVPGGSSGGSAAAVAAGLVPYALGSDTGGSIRQPASFCGVVGLKPTYGRVSRYGLLALASSLDVIGPLTRSVEDAAYVLESIAGYDVMDATTVRTDVPKYSDYLNKGVNGLRIGIPKEYFGEGITEGTKKAVNDGIKKLESLGAKISEVSLPSSPYALAAYYIILPVEVSANTSRYDGIRYAFRAPEARGLAEIYSNTRGLGFGAEVKRRIMLGTYASSSGYYDAYYKQALVAQNYIKSDFARVFKTVDCLVTPTTPTTAFKLGEKAADPLQMYLADIFTVGVNIAGIPAISIPAGLDNGLPVGMQIIAPWFREDLLFQAAGAYEAADDWHNLKPSIWEQNNDTK